MSMHIAILGAGAMGSVFGARLSMGGAKVTLLDVNDAHVDTILEHGLQVYLDGQLHTLNLPAMRPEEFTGTADVFLLFTKTFHTESALAAVERHLNNAYVFSLQNGIGNAERIKAFVPEERIILGMTLTPADFLGPGHVSSHGSATTAFYSLDGSGLPILDKLLQAMNLGGINAKTDPVIQSAIWEKAAFNCAMNALCALSDATPGAIGESTSGRALATQVVYEVVGVANALNIAADREKVEELVNHACTHHLMHEPSMLQDRKAGRRTEIDALNGAVADWGEKLGIDVQANRTLAQLIHLIDDSRRFRTQLAA